MNNVNFNSEEFKKTQTYQDFIKENQGEGRLLIKASSAQEAIPIENLRIKVSVIIGNTRIIFFDGVTDSSGMIPKIKLPAPKTDPDNLVVPAFTTYNIVSTYNNMDTLYKVNMYDNICVIQNINIVPEIIERGFMYGR